MKLYELANPSDPYTFYAPSVDVAGACVALLSPSYGARAVDGSEATPILFGWDEWLSERGIDPEWTSTHAEELAEAFDSFLIGKPSARAEVEATIANMPMEERDAWRLTRQEHERTSFSKIGELAYRYAEHFRRIVEKAGAT